MTVSPALAILREVDDQPTSDLGEGVNQLAISERLNKLEAELAELRADHEAAQAEQSTVGGGDIGSDPDVLAAAQALAQAIARAQGIDLPLQAAPGASLPVLQVPAQFAEQGGVGISIMVATPQG